MALTEMRNPEIEFVSGTRVGRHLAWTDYGQDFGSCRIKVPDFNHVIERADKKARHVYAKLRDGLLDYIIGHELYVEAAHMPQSEADHGRWEADYLRSIEGTYAHAIGLALHKLRLEHGSREERSFTEETSKHYDFDDSFKRYGEYLDRMARMLGDVLEGDPRNQDCLSNLEDIDPW